MNKNWYAVYTKPKCEKKVSASLTKKKIENYCPLNRLTRQATDRKKVNLDPLFPSYVFVHITDLEMASIRQTSDVVNFVYWLGRPAQVKDVEIETIQHFINEYSDVSLEKTPVNTTEMVRIVSNQLEETEVFVMNNTQTLQVKVTLPSLGYMMIAETTRSNVKLLDYSNVPQVKDMVS
jgi:transcription antitermination factor NusG